MSNVSTISNPLMQPIEYKDKTYFTGQYFHQMYRNNSNMNGKYKRAGDFMRLIRNLETYQLYVDSADIVEITKEEANANLASAFKATFGKPIMLISATAQVALTHHLDDEVSKKASVAVNRHAVESIAAPRLREVRVAPVLLEAELTAARLLGTSDAMAKPIAVKLVREATGVDFEPLLIGNSVEEAPMTPKKLGERIGGWSAQKVNKMLAAGGFQTKDDEGNWQATEKGKKHASYEPYASSFSDHSGYRWMWFSSVIDLIKDAAA